jgi:hypothetical protein
MRPIRRHRFTAIETSIFLGSASLMLAPRFEVCLGAPGEEHGPRECSNGIAATFHEARSKAKRGCPDRNRNATAISELHRACRHTAQSCRHARLRNRRASIRARAQKHRLHRAARILLVDQHRLLLNSRSTGASYTANQREGGSPPLARS